MKPILTHLFSGLFLLLAAQAFAQPTMTTNFVVTTPPSSPQDYPIGTHIVIELRVNNFTNIESMQFPIVYNKDAMKFDSLTNSVFSNWNAGNFTNLIAGKVGISWDGYSNGANSPFSFPNGTALFKLHFTVIGNGLSTVNISPTAAPPAIDIAGNGGATVILNYQGGGTPTIVLGSGNPPPPPLMGFKIVANTIYIPQGERGCMPVTVNDFDQIVSMQYAMHWNNSVLNFECTRAYNLPGWSSTDFNSIYAPGTLLCGWADPAGQGVTRVDGARIVDVCFKAIGAPGTNTTVTIDGVGFPPGNGHEEAYNANSVDVWQPINHVNGYSGVSAPINVIVTPPAPTDVTITAETLDVPPSTQGCISVKVKNFTAITNTEFALSYNMAELTYNNYSFGANPLNLQAANITHVPNIPSPGTGVVKFLWANTNGATVPTDGTIFSVCFTPVVSLPVGQTSNINFTTTACPTITGMGVAKATGGVPMARVNGGIKVVQMGPNLNATPVSCFGGTNGTISLDNPPASTPTGYQWSNGATIEDLTGLPAGTYTVTVTYAGGTTGTGTAIVTQPSAAITETHTVNTVSCFGGANGAINLSVSGGNAGGYTYLWSTGATVEDPAGLAAGNYTVIVKDTKNCTLTSGLISITGPSQITLPAGNQTVTNVSCSGLSNGSIVITPTGGTGGYTYDWSHNGAQTPDTDPKDLVGMPSGTYTVTVTDANGCTAVLPSSGQGISITAPPALVTNLDSKSDVKCQGSTNGCASISVNGGTGPYSYCWNSGSSCVATIEDPCTLPAGSFNVVITDQKGCTATLPVNVNIAAPTGGAIQITPASTPSACFDNPTGTITMTVTGGWSNFTYAWNPSLPAISNPINVAPGTYTLTATDGGQCTATASVTVTGATAITNGTTIEHVTCNGLSNGSIDLNLAGGSPGYTVVWSNTPQTGEVITNLLPGAYQPTITDSHGCSKILSPITVNGVAAITQNTMIQPVTCFGLDNGGIDLNLAGGTPGYTVVWSNTVLTGEAISNLEPGAYQPTVTDNHGCTQVFPAITVTEPSELFFSEVITATNPTGAIDLTYVSGGTPGFTYLWSNGATTQDVNNLAVGTYTVTITDSNLCPRSFSYVVPEGDVFSGGVDVFAISNTCDHDGKIILDIPQAAASQMPFTLNWGTGPQGPYNSLMPVIDNLSAGVYSVTVTAANGNSAIVTNITIAQKEPASVNSNTQNPFDANQNGKIILNVAPGVTGPLTYQWGPPLNTTGPIVSNLDSGCYTVTITNTNPLSGCTAEQTFCLVREYATLAFGASTAVTNPNCANSPTGKIVVILTGGNDPYVYNWVGPNGFTASTSTIQDLGPGVYDLTVTDDNGNTLTNSWTLTAQSNINITNVNETSIYPSGDQVSSAIACDGAAAVVFIPGVGTSNILWSNGVTTANNTTLCGGPYSVTVTDAVGCSSVWSDALTAPAGVSITSQSVGVSCHGDCNGSAKVVATGGAAPYKMQWSTGQLDQAVQAGQFSQAINLCGGEYLVTVTDKNGLETVYSLEVQEPDEITAIFAPTTPRNFNACDGQMVVALTGAVAPVEYLWSSANHATSTNERYENLCSGELIYLSITDANGCTLNTFDTIPYPEDGCFRVSPVLTPGQQDGKNDNVYITCIETALENHIEIYTRWGQLVFQADDYTNDDTDRDHNWNGLTNSGAALAEGVYYYVLTYTFVDDQGKKQDGIRKGAINLLR